MVRLDRLLVVGLGSIGKRHVRVAKSLMPNVRIVALRRAESAALAEPGVEDQVTTMTDALAFKPQAAVVANPASHHLAVSQALVEAGVPVLIEKPIAHESRGVTELLAAARAHRVILMTGYNLRFDPALRHFRELLRAQAVGKVLSVRAEVGQYLPTWRPGVDYRQTVSARRELGGGVLLELSHEFDYLRWVFGEVEWVQATCTRQSRLEIDVEDTAHVILGFAPVGGGPPLIGALSMDFVRHDPTRVCTAIGECGSLRWNGMAGSVELFEAKAKGWRELFLQIPQRDESYGAQWKHFLDCIRGNLCPVTTGEEGLAALRIVETARQAAESGERVPVVPAPTIARPSV